MTCDIGVDGRHHLYGLVSTESTSTNVKVESVSGIVDWIYSTITQ